MYESILFASVEIVVGRLKKETGFLFVRVCRIREGKDFCQRRFQAVCLSPIAGNFSGGRLNRQDQSDVHMIKQSRQLHLQELPVIPQAPRTREVGGRRRNCIMLLVDGDTAQHASLKSPPDARRLTSDDRWTAGTSTCLRTSWLASHFRKRKKKARRLVGLSALEVLGSNR